MKRFIPLLVLSITLAAAPVAMADHCERCKPATLSCGPALNFGFENCEWTFDRALAARSLTNYAHIVLFAVFFLLTCAQLPNVRKALAWSAGACFVMGLFVELAQGMTGAGHCRMRDLIPDSKKIGSDDAATRNAVERAYQAFTDPRNTPVYIHCDHGRDRSGFIVALYRARTQVWSFGQISNELAQHGHGLLMRRYLPNITRQLARETASAARTQRSFGTITHAQ